MRIHRRIIATGREWKPCIECNQKFDKDEILTAVDTDSNRGVMFWFCEKCTEELFGHLLRKGWRKKWRLNHRGKTEEIDFNGAA